MTIHQDFDQPAARLLALRISIFQFQTLPFERLKSRNLREELHGVGVIPKGYFSYCCSQKAPFRKPGSLDRSLIELCKLNELQMMKPGTLQKRHGIDINAKATLFMVGPAFNQNYGNQLEALNSGALQRNVPVSYPVSRLMLERNANVVR